MSTVLHLRRGVPSPDCTEGCDSAPTTTLAAISTQKMRQSRRRK